MKGYFLILLFVCFFAIYSYSQESFSQNGKSILPLLSMRHSGRLYDASRPVTQEQIRKLVQAARLAPSSYNEQPWNFIICDRTTQPDAYAKALSCLVEFNQNWAVNAPVLIVIAANTQSNHMKTFNRWGTYDTGAAAISVALEATAMGLMAHQMGGFNEIKIKELFNIPEEFSPMAVMAVGYEASEQNGDLPLKQRHPINENFFVGTWGIGLEK